MTGLVTNKKKRRRFDRFFGMIFTAHLGHVCVFFVAHPRVDFVFPNSRFETCLGFPKKKIRRKKVAHIYRSVRSPFVPLTRN